MIDASNEQTPAAQTQRAELTVSATWGNAAGLEPIYVEELAFQSVRDAVYLNFGQVRLPFVGGEAPPNLKVEIQPVARVVMTRETLLRMLPILNQIGAGPSTEDKE